MNNKKEIAFNENSDINDQDVKDLEEYYKLENSKPASKERTEEKIPD